MPTALKMEKKKHANTMGRTSQKKAMTEK